MGLVSTGAIVNLPAVAIVALVTTICYRGIRQSSLVNGFIVAAKIIVILLVIGFGVFYVDPDNWKPFVPENTGVRGQFGPSGVLRRLGSHLLRLHRVRRRLHGGPGGEESATAIMPIAIIASLLICTVLYVLMSGALTGMVPYPQLNDAAPVAVALMAHEGLRWLVPWVIVGAIAGHDLRHARHDARPGAHLPLDVA